MRSDAIWELRAAWFDGDTLRGDREFFSTKRDATAVGEELKQRHDSEDADFSYEVQQVAPWPSSTRDVPFTDTPTIEQMTNATEKEWDL